jgi:membrane protease YdiL (CAAX protease family)
VNSYAFGPLDLWQIATFVALLAAVVGLWIAPRVWWSCLAAATVCGYIAGVLDPVAVVWLALGWIVCEVYVRTPTESGPRRVLSILGVITMVVLLGLHVLPGFHNPLVIDHLKLTPDAAPYTLYLNFDKTFAGLLLIGVCYREWPGRAALRSVLRGQVGVLIVGNVMLLIGASYLLGYVRLQPKWTTLFWFWSAVNLFSTCLSEEAFFRGFVQRELQAIGRNLPHGQLIALGVSALLFGLAHFAGGWRYVLLATLAGMGYGYIYQRTQRLECSLLAHFALNATHFLCFTYPQLA